MCLFFKWTAASQSHRPEEFPSPLIPAPSSNTPTVNGDSPTLASTWMVVAPAVTLLSMRSASAVLSEYLISLMLSKSDEG